MSKPLRCKLGLHHWHYETEIVGSWLHAHGSCWRCGKTDIYTCDTLREWFLFSNDWADRIQHELKGESHD